ncbi:MAG TPA: hypothetical protein VI957_01055 [Candidatus Paceibacterota bacterium]
MVYSFYVWKEKPLVAPFESAYATTKEMKPGDKITVVIRFKKKEVEIQEVLGSFFVKTTAGKVSVYNIIGHTDSSHTLLIETPTS